jgi:U6 snRNA-associated Sm-like protein LSm7
MMGIRVYIDPEDPEQITGKTRHLGLVVIRGTQVSLVSPEDGLEEIANPFLGGADEEEEEDVVEADGE